MRSLFLSPLLLLLAFQTMAQAQKSKGYKITYLSSNHGEISANQDPKVLLVNDHFVKGSSVKKLANEATFPFEEFYIDWQKSPAEYIRSAYFSKQEISKTIDTSFIGKHEYKLTDETKKILGYTCSKAVTIVNSNTIELWYTKELPYKASPVSMGQELGMVLEYVRNRNTAITATEIEKVKLAITIPDAKLTDALSYQDALWKSSFIHIPVFEKEQINFINNSESTEEVLRFASGTTILKKVKIPELKAGMLGFVQATQRSLGDAYDRTASVFLIRESEKETF